MTAEERFKEAVLKGSGMYRMGTLWQFLCDSVYDLFHLHDKYGQENLRGWWDMRVDQWNHWGNPFR